MENRKNRLYTDAMSFASIVLCKYPVIFVLASQTRRRVRLGYRAIVTDTEEKGKKTVCRLRGRSEEAEAAMCMA